MNKLMNSAMMPQIGHYELRSVTRKEFAEKLRRRISGAPAMQKFKDYINRISIDMIIIL